MGDWSFAEDMKLTGVLCKWWWFARQSPAHDHASIHPSIPCTLCFYTCCRLGSSSMEAPNSQASEFKSFSDACIKAPQLLESCVCAWPSREAGIRNIRLICKELAVTALTATQLLSVKIGEGASLESQQGIRMMLCMSQVPLKQLDFTVVISTGWSVNLKLETNTRCLHAPL